MPDPNHLPPGQRRIRIPRAELGETSIEAVARLRDPLRTPWRWPESTPVERHAQQAADRRREHLTAE